MVDRTGQKLDNYRLLRSLGVGSFGEVYLAEHLTHATLVAIKVLPRFDEKDWPGFLNEARVIRLRHTHILPVLDFGIESGTPFLVMEYLANGTLRQRYPKGTRVPLPVVALYIKQIASALQYAHNENLIHRDVKPENLLLRSENEVVLGDFGIVAIVRSATSMDFQTSAGTLPYMAPEQIQGRAVTASDQYGLGVIAYEWLCGVRPFQGSLVELVHQHSTMQPPALRAKNPALPVAVDQVVLRALAKEPTQRFPHILAFAEALEAACAPRASLSAQPAPHPAFPLQPDLGTPAERSALSPMQPMFPQQAVAQVPVERLTPPGPPAPMQPMFFQKQHSVAPAEKQPVTPPPMQPMFSQQPPAAQKSQTTEPPAARNSSQNPLPPLMSFPSTHQEIKPSTDQEP